MLNRSGKSGKFSRVSDLRGKAIKYNASFRFFVQIIFQFMFPFIPSVLSLLYFCHGIWVKFLFLLKIMNIFLQQI